MIGTDILEVERMQKMLQNPTFLNRVFTKQEQQYAQNCKNVASHLCGFFCAKEAVMKALVDCKKISFLDIEVCHENSGKPYVKLYKTAQQVFSQKSAKSIEISISQTDKYATAVCVVI